MRRHMPLPGSCLRLFTITSVLLVMMENVDEEHGFEMVTVDGARQARLEAVAAWVDELLLAKGETVTGSPSDVVLARIKEAAAAAPPKPLGRDKRDDRRLGGVAGAVAWRVWRLRGALSTAAKAGQTAVIVARLALALYALSSLGISL